jgi:hypothetical protein
VFRFSYELVPFTKLGWKNEQGAWMFMLGAVTVGTVDLGLDNVVITPDRYKDMFFTLPIVQSMYVLGTAPCNFVQFTALYLPRQRRAHFF